MIAVKKDIQGAIWILAACLCFASMNAIAKEISSDRGGEIHALQLAFARYGVAVLVLLPFVSTRTDHWKPTHLPRYLIRTIAGFGGIVLMFIAVQFVPLAAATAIGFTSPIFAMLFAVIFLRERLSKFRWFAGSLGLTGAIIIALPDGASISLAVLIPIAAAIFMGAEIVSIKWLSQTKDHPITIIFYSNLMGAVIAFLGASTVWIMPSSTQLAQMAVLGSVAVVGQFCVLRGVILAEASLLAPFFYSSLVYSAVFGYFFFEEVPALSTILGSGIILFSAYILTKEKAAKVMIASTRLRSKKVFVRRGPPP